MTRLPFADVEVAGLADAVQTRFWAKVDKDGPGGCWLWTGTVAGGYGRFSLKPWPSPLAAHRLAYEWLVGEIPVGLELDHLCHSNSSSCRGGKSCPHRRCINPDHLEPVTRRVNALRGQAPTAKAYRNGTCLKGHPMIPSNVHVRANGARYCLECQAANGRAGYRRKVGRPVVEQVRGARGRRSLQP